MLNTFCTIKHFHILIAFVGFLRSDFISLLSKKVKSFKSFSEFVTHRSVMNEFLQATLIISKVKRENHNNVGVYRET